MIDSAGKVAFEFPSWPAAVPPGLTTYLQLLVIDGAATQGIAFSNAMIGITP